MSETLKTTIRRSNALNKTLRCRPCQIAKDMVTESGMYPLNSWWQRGKVRGCGEYYSAVTERKNPLNQQRWRCGKLRGSVKNLKTLPNVKFSEIHKPTTYVAGMKFTPRRKWSHISLSSSNESRSVQSMLWQYTRWECLQRPISPIGSDRQGSGHPFAYPQGVQVGMGEVNHQMSSISQTSQEA